MDNFRNHRKHSSLLSAVVGSDESQDLSKNATNKKGSVKAAPTFRTKPHSSLSYMNDTSAMRRLIVGGISMMVIVGLSVFLIKMAKEMAGDLREMGV